jgi:hypothetical protein
LAAAAEVFDTFLAILKCPSNTPVRTISDEDLPQRTLANSTALREEEFFDGS